MPAETRPPDGLVCGASLSRAFSFLGKRWNGVILGNLFAGPTTFSALARQIEGISDSMLATRLAELVHAGLVRRVVNEGPPVAVSYALSAAGEALLPALRELEKWASQNLTEARCRERDQTATLG